MPWRLARPGGRLPWDSVGPGEWGGYHALLHVHMELADAGLTAIFVHPNRAMKETHEKGMPDVSPAGAHGLDNVKNQVPANEGRTFPA